MDLVLLPEVLIPVFKKLTVTDLLVCMRVCRAWNRCSVDSCLWKCLDLSHQSISQFTLSGIIRRQPQVLHTNHSFINPKSIYFVTHRNNNVNIDKLLINVCISLYC